MIDKLRSNFALTSNIIKIAFVILCSIASFPSFKSAIIMTGMDMPVLFGVVVAVIASVILLLIVPFVIGLIMNFAKLYNHPKAEFSVIALACFCISFVVVILGNLLALALPYMGIWIGIIFNFLSILVGMLLFYKITSKLYFNSLTRPYYFNLMCIIFAVIVVLEVI